MNYDIKTTKAGNTVGTVIDDQDVVHQYLIANNVAGWYVKLKGVSVYLSHFHNPKLFMTLLPMIHKISILERDTEVSNEFTLLKNHISIYSLKGPRKTKKKLTSFLDDDVFVKQMLGTDRMYIRNDAPSPPGPIEYRVAPTPPTEIRIRNEDDDGWF